MIRRAEARTAAPAAGHAIRCPVDAAVPSHINQVAHCIAHAKPREAIVEHDQTIGVRVTQRGQRIIERVRRIMVAVNHKSIKAAYHYVFTPALCHDLIDAMPMMLKVFLHPV